MSQIQIECQGLPCPQPVLRCKDSIEKQSPDSLCVVVDNEAAKENVSRYMTTQGYEASVETKGDEFVITGIKKTQNNDTCVVCEEMSAAELTGLTSQKLLVFIASDVMGSGDDDLGGKLMYNFLLTLKEMGSDLWRVVMVNGGVKLAVKDNPCMEELQKLEKEGVSVLVCGTCLEHFGLNDQRGVGDVTNMLDIITSFQLASKTIRV